MKHYTLKKRKGYDDLLAIHAFVGNSQGDETATNDINDYVNSGGWLSYVFDKDTNPNDQEAIDKESIRRKEHNDKYIQKLKDENKYGEEYEVNIFIQDYSLFDDSNVPSNESYRFAILNFDSDKS